MLQPYSSALLHTFVQKLRQLLELTQIDNRPNPGFPANTDKSRSVVPHDTGYNQ